MKEQLFYNEVMEMVRKFEGVIELKDYYFPEGSYIKNGFSLKLKVNASTKKDKGKNLTAKFVVDGNIMQISGNGLDDIENTLRDIIITP